VLSRGKRRKIKEKGREGKRRKEKRGKKRRREEKRREEKRRKERKREERREEERWIMAKRQLEWNEIRKGKLMDETVPT
jgi:hypothetical protein